MSTASDHERILGVTQPCCETWTMAHGSGTDNEGYEALISDGRMGYELPPLRFCPWCGTPKSRLEAAFCAEPQRSIVDAALRKIGDPSST